MAESFLQEVLKVLPSSLQDLEIQCTRHGVEDYPQLKSLLNDRSLSAGLHRDWRKAVFRLLDCIFVRFGLPNSEAHDRLNIKIFPFTTYYFPVLLSGVSEGGLSNSDDDTDHRREQAKSVLEETLRDASDRATWSRVSVLTRCLSAYTDLEGMCLKISALLTGAQSKVWTEFAECLRIADRYDMSRKVYQSLDQDDLWTGIMDLSMEERGDVLDFWQSTIDGRFGEYSKLKRAMFKIVKETCTLPNSMILRGIRLKSNEPVHGGGCADIYEGILRDLLVALKVLRIFNKDDMQAVFRELCKEAIVWRQLRHENVAPFLGLCNDLFPTRVALISPWMSNGDLSSYLSMNPDADRVPLAVQIASGLSYLHSQDPQIIHGDLRANNVLVDDKHVARITDFGISKVNVVQTKLSVHSNRGSARWQAPELHYNEEGLSHVTTKSDVYAYGMTCFEIFTEKMPFAHLPSDGMVIMELLQKHSKPERPTDPNIQSRGMTDRLWSLLEDCWEFDAQSRPSMTEVLTIVQNESRFIAKERERKRKLAAAGAPENEEPPKDVSNSLSQSEAANSEEKNALDDVKPVQHSPIRLPLELRLEEPLQQHNITASPPRTSTVLPPPSHTLNNVVDSQTQYISRGRVHPIGSQDHGNIGAKPENFSRAQDQVHRTPNALTSERGDVSLIPDDAASSNVNVRSSAPMMLKDNRTFSGSSDLSTQTTVSKFSELSCSTALTSPNGSPVQEKKNSLDSYLISSTDRHDAAVDVVKTPVSSAQTSSNQHLRAEPPKIQTARKEPRVSFGSPKPTSTTLLEVETTESLVLLPNARQKPRSLTLLDDEAMERPISSPKTQVDSPKSNSMPLLEATEARPIDPFNARESKTVPILSGSPLGLTSFPTVPRITDSPQPLYETRVEKTIQSDVVEILAEARAKDVDRGGRKPNAPIMQEPETVNHENMMSAGRQGAVVDVRKPPTTIPQNSPPHSLRTESPRTEIPRTQPRVSFGSPKTEPVTFPEVEVSEPLVSSLNAQSKSRSVTLLEVDATESPVSFPKVQADNPKSNSTSPPISPETRALDRLSARESKTTSIPTSSSTVPGMTDLPQPFYETREEKPVQSNLAEPKLETRARNVDKADMKANAPIMREPERLDHSSQSRSPKLTREQTTQNAPGSIKINNTLGALSRSGHQDVEVLRSVATPSSHSNKLRNRMGAVKLSTGPRPDDEDHSLSAQPPHTNTKGGKEAEKATEPSEEHEEDAWGLDSASPAPSFEKQDMDRIEEELDISDPLQSENKEEKRALLKYTALADDSSKKQEPEIESIIEADVQDFFDKRDMDEARTYFLGLPAEYRYKLIAQLTMYAIDSEKKENVDALLVADLFDKSTENDWCSASDYEKAARAVVDDLNKDRSPGVDVAVASIRLDVILGGMDLTEAFRSSMLRQLRQVDSTPRSKLGNNVRSDSFSSIASASVLPNSPRANKVKID